MSHRDLAVMITARERAELVPVNRDTRPLGPREIGGATLASLISAGTELNGAYLGSNFPCGVGYASVFQVEEAGAEVDQTLVGKRVIAMGGHRSYQRVQAADSAILPDGLPAEQATFARMMVVSMSTLTTTTARPPSPVLVIGLGLVGHLAAQMFAACGYAVTACDPSEKRRALAMGAGRCGTVLAAIPALEPGARRPFALALECSGNEDAAIDACRVVRNRGEVVLVGTPWKRYTDRTAHELVWTIFHNYIVMRSGWEWEIGLQPEDFRPASIYGNMQGAVDWLASGRVVVDDLYEAVSPADAQSAYQSLLHGAATRLGVVFDWRRV